MGYGTQVKSISTLKANAAEILQELATLRRPLVIRTASQAVLRTSPTTRRRDARVAEDPGAGPGAGRRRAGEARRRGRRALARRSPTARGMDGEASDSRAHRDL